MLKPEMLYCWIGLPDTAMRRVVEARRMIGKTGIPEVGGMITKTGISEANGIIAKMESTNSEAGEKAVENGDAVSEAGSGGDLRTAGGEKVRTECKNRSEERGKGEDLLEALRRPQTACWAYEKLKTSLGDDPGSWKMLACQLECAGRDYVDYRKLGISEEIYIATMKCFSRFLGECRKNTGCEEFDRGWWTWRQTSMLLFRIGELEYERTEYRGECAVSIHIPSDCVLIRERIRESLELARDFMKKYYPEYENVVYFCESWLLSPRLRTILPEASHIRQFQEMFELIEGLPEDREFLQWVFGTQEDMPVSGLPERTSLQRKIKEQLLAGQNLGAAVGMLRNGF